MKNEPRPHRAAHKVLTLAATLCGAVALATPAVAGPTSSRGPETSPQIAGGPTAVLPAPAASPTTAGPSQLRVDGAIRMPANTAKRMYHDRGPSRDAARDRVDNRRDPIRRDNDLHRRGQLTFSTAAGSPALTATEDGFRRAHLGFHRATLTPGVQRDATGLRVERTRVRGYFNPYHRPVYHRRGGGCR